ncbi:MAG TPA: VOC family protein [Mycobacteriales bacterium]|nr:VOC family protein [Mycobacteriales bacterium]
MNGPTDSGAQLNSVSPFFIVSDLQRAVNFYRDRLGFAVTYSGPDGDPFFAVIRRDGVQLMLKAVGVAAQPNRQRQPDARWDAYLHVSRPEPLAAEFRDRGVTFSSDLADTDDGLRGFELTDADGYVLFFGRPRPD